MEENDEIFFFREREDEIEELINDTLLKRGKFSDLEVLDESVYW